MRPALQTLAVVATLMALPALAATDAPDRDAQCMDSCLKFMSDFHPFAARPHVQCEDACAHSKPLRFNGSPFAIRELAVGGLGVILADGLGLGLAFLAYGAGKASLRDGLIAGSVLVVILAPLGAMLGVHFVAERASGRWLSYLAAFVVQAVAMGAVLQVGLAVHATDTLLAELVGAGLVLQLFSLPAAVSVAVHLTPGPQLDLPSNIPVAAARPRGFQLPLVAFSF